MNGKLIILTAALGIAATPVAAGDDELREKAKGTGLKPIPYGIQSV